MLIEAPIQTGRSCGYSSASKDFDSNMSSGIPTSSTLNIKIVKIRTIRAFHNEFHQPGHCRSKPILFPHSIIPEIVIPGASSCVPVPDACHGLMTNNS